MGRVGRDGEEVVEASGELSFEASESTLGRLAFGSFAGQVLAGFGVVLGAGDRDDVQRVVELPITATVEPMLVALTRGALDRRGTGL